MRSFVGKTGLWGHEGKRGITFPTVDEKSGFERPLTGPKWRRLPVLWEYQGYQRYCTDLGFNQLKFLFYGMGLGREELFNLFAYPRGSLTHVKICWRIGRSVHSPPGSGNWSSKIAFKLTKSFSILHYCTFHCSLLRHQHLSLSIQWKPSCVGQASKWVQVPSAKCQVQRSETDLRHILIVHLQPLFWIVLM